MSSSSLLIPPKKDYSKVPLVFFSDIDNTLFIYSYTNVMYTGLSSTRWRWFYIAIRQHYPGVIFGLITKKDRASRSKANVYNGMPSFPKHEISSHYDDFCHTLFGISRLRGLPADPSQSLMDLLNPDFIYFIGTQGSKSAAMKHAHREHLGPDFDPKKLWLMDDSPDVWKDLEEQKDFNLIRVPKEMYEIPASQRYLLAPNTQAGLEEACIQLMLNTLERLCVKPSPEALAQITKRNFSLHPLRSLEERRSPEERKRETPFKPATRMAPQLTSSLPQGKEHKSTARPTLNPQSSLVKYGMFAAAAVTVWVCHQVFARSPALKS